LNIFLKKKKERNTVFCAASPCSHYPSSVSTHYQPLITNHSLPTTHYQPLITNHSLPTAAAGTDDGMNKFSIIQSTTQSTEPTYRLSTYNTVNNTIYNSNFLPGSKYLHMDTFFRMKSFAALPLSLTKSDGSSTASGMTSDSAIKHDFNNANRAEVGKSE